MDILSMMKARKRGKSETTAISKTSPDSDKSVQRITDEKKEKDLRKDEDAISVKTDADSTEKHHVSAEQEANSTSETGRFHDSSHKTKPLTPQWKIHGSHMVTRLPPASCFKNYFRDKIDSFSNTVSVAAFDMDDTLITTKSGIKFGRGPHDWKWRNDQILPVLRKKVRDENMVFVVFTNQKAVSVTESLAPNSKSYKNLTVKFGLMSNSLDSTLGPFPVLFFASTGKPRKGVFPRSSDETHSKHRKPEIGMWNELERYIKRCLGPQVSINTSCSYFVGDAAGRDGDHSAVDLGFAGNAGVPFYVPEDYFGM